MNWGQILRGSPGQLRILMNTMKNTHWVAALVLLMVRVSPTAADEFIFDVAVYGSTPGEFCAAIAAAREGASVVLLEPTDHIGGMNTGGLSHCDSNQMVRSTVMGLFDEWHSLVVGDYTDRGLDAPYNPAVKDQTRWTFEPHVAMRVTMQMLDEAGVTVLTGRQLKSVAKYGARITSLVTKNGTFGARSFVAGTYEGDLMAAAAVDWTIGREGHEEYAESLAGKQYPKQKMNINDIDSNGKLLPANKKVAGPVPDRLVVLTFDDSAVTHATHVGPLLKKYGFGATFFITEGFNFTTNKNDYMTWEQIRKLHDAGFEIGNHTRRHTAVSRQTPAEIDSDVAHIEEQCIKYDIPKPVSFCYPGYATSDDAVNVLSERGYRFARAGGARAFDPARDNPLLMPQAFDGKPDSTFEQFVAATAMARDGRIAVMTFHGIPDAPHPWVSTTPAMLERYLKHLVDENCTVIALRDLERYLHRKDNSPRDRAESRNSTGRTDR